MINAMRLRKKVPAKGKGSEDYLEITVRDDASDSDVEAIVQALATVSDFFNVRLVSGGGGSGGNMLRSKRPASRGYTDILRKNREPGSPRSELPPLPPTDPDSRIGWRG